MRSAVPQVLRDGSRIQQPAHGFDAIHGQADPAGMLAYQGFVRSVVDAIDFIVGNKAANPPNVGSHVVENFE